MSNYLMKVFALSNKGAKDLIRAIIWTIISSVLIMFFTAFFYWFLSDSVLPSLAGYHPVFTLLSYVIFFILLFSLLCISHYFLFAVTYISSYQESSVKRVDLAERLRLLPLSFFGKKDLSDLTTIIMTDMQVIETAFSHFIPQLYGSAIATIIVSIALLSFNFIIGLSIIWVVPVSLILMFISKKIQDKFHRKSKLIQLSYIEKIEECINNVRNIKANNRVNNHLEEIKEKFITYEKYSLKVELFVGILVSLAQMILKFGIVTSMLTGIYLLLRNELSILHFLIFLMVASRIFDSLSNSLINLAAIFHSLVSVERMKDLENINVQTGKTDFDSKCFDITFKDVYFSYNDRDILRGVSFTAKQGEVTALVGESGSGKSTILKLAARFWDINSGIIKIGEEDISLVDPETLLKHISIVFQEVILFNNSVMENIRIGRKDASDEDVIRAAKAANSHEFIMKMEEGYDSIIGENGSFLSSGQRQRISIARALLKDAPIIFLDEATSSLDVVNEALVQQAISRLIKDKTVIVIAHRMRTIMGADKIILLKGGQVINVGTHDKLMKDSTHYFKMINMQLKGINYQLI